MKKLNLETLSTHLKLSLTTCLLLLCSAVFSQTFKVNTTIPQNLSIVDFNNQEIVISFNLPIQKNKINQAVRIFGEWTGTKDFDYELASNNRLILSLKNNTTPPLAGEKITVSISQALTSSNNKSLSTGYASQFYMLAKPGTLIQKSKESIPLKEAGDTWLQTTGAFAGDLNNDGHIDLTLANAANAELKILMNDQRGSFDKSTSVSTNGLFQSTTQSGDFDEDGKIDLAIGAKDNSALSVLMGDGTGGFSSVKEFKEGDAARALVVLDYDADGDEDIVLANAKEDQLALFSNDGTGSFAYSKFPLQAKSPTTIEAADANNDGILDLFVGYFDSQKIGILLGDGKGGFEMSDEVEVLGNPWMIAVADLNGDHNADVASVNANGNVTVVIFGDGTGGLMNPKTYALQTTKMPKGIDLGDIDGDGDMDMVTANYNSNNFIVWENNAQGVMSRAAILSGSKNPSAVLINDHDNDGDLDIIGTDAGSDEVFIFDNSTEIINAYLDINSPITAQITPNPFVNRLKIKAYIPRTGRTDVRILDASGRTLERLWDDRLESGDHYFGWDGRSNVSSVPPGVYYVTITQNGKVYSWPVVKN